MMNIRKFQEKLNHHGHHNLVEFKQCEADWIGDKTQMTTILREALLAAKMEFVKIASHQFEPTGTTVIAIVTESHVALHSYPENAHVSLDIFSAYGENPHQELVEFLSDKFAAKEVVSMRVQRGPKLKVIE